MNYILDGHKAIPEPDLMKWAQWFETADRRVAMTELPDGCTVFTSFMGIDYNWGEGSPLLFETMVRKANEEWMDIQRRYGTWEDAVKGHQEICYQLRVLDGPESA